MCLLLHFTSAICPSVSTDSALIVFVLRPQAFEHAVLQMVVMPCDWVGIPVVGTYPKTSLVQKGFTFLRSKFSLHADMIYSQVQLSHICCFVNIFSILHLATLLTLISSPEMEAVRLFCSSWYVSLHIKFKSPSPCCIQSFAVFGASGNSVPFPNWWGNPATLSVDRCKVRNLETHPCFIHNADAVTIRQLTLREGRAIAAAVANFHVTACIM
jgi:hypothetical protein